MADCIERDYETLAQKGIFEVWGAVLRECEAQEIPDENHPSYATFHTRVSSRPRAEQVRKRKGNRAAYEHETFIYWIDQNSPLHGDRPFHIAHIDHTKIELELVSSLTGENLGRPWASFMVDAFSRRLLAILVTYDEPSYRTNMMLFRECVRRFGRLPQTLVIDGGRDLNGHYFRQFAATFEITIKIRPAGKPRHGSVCERLFGTNVASHISAKQSLADRSEPGFGRRSGLLGALVEGQQRLKIGALKFAPAIDHQRLRQPTEAAH